MKYTVKYAAEAEQELADIWLASADRNGLTAVMAEIDIDLSLRPLDVAESRQSSLNRLLIRPPVRVAYEVIPDDELVVVQGIFPAKCPCSQVKPCRSLRLLSMTRTCSRG